ncbi:MAG: sensor histidine kinase [Acidimicrobiia bacterium]
MQVVINLLSNAIKFSAPGDGRVWVQVDRSDGLAQVRVADNGSGVPRAHREVIFEKFRQVADSEVGRPAGTGLGLPISRQIISHLGGSMWVDDRPGTGAVFSFTLPMLEPARRAEYEGAAG